MNQGLSASDLNLYLSRLGDELAAEGVGARLLVVGGAALVLRGIVDRATQDVDVLARVHEGTLICAAPLTPELSRAIARVAENYAGKLAEDWVNTTVAGLWQKRWPEELKTGLLTDVEWRTFGTLEVGLAGRSVLIPLKVHAAVDQAWTLHDISGRLTGADLSPSDAQRHLHDLYALAPDDDELSAAATWVREQDASDLGPILEAILDDVRAHRR